MKTIEKKIRESAEKAAETHEGPKENPYPEGSISYYEWLHFYYAHVLTLSMDIAA